MVNVDLNEMLAERADSVVPPVFEADAVMARGERLVRRRRSLVAGGAALAVAGALGLSAVITDPADRPLPAEPVPEWATGTRPLTYGQGQTLHLGEREIDTGMDFLTIDLTDDGAALTTIDGGIWFTDGTTVERIGTTLSVCCVRSDGWSWRAGRPPEWVASDSAGSLLAWLEFRERVYQPELVVYDSSTRTFVAREPVDTTAANTATIVALADRAVFVSEVVRGTVPEVPLKRFDLDSGALEPTTGQELAAAVRGVPRALAVGPVSNGLVVGAPERLVGGPPMTETLDVVGSVIANLHDPGTGDAVEITVPDVLSESPDLWFTQWLDDDSFAVTTYVGKPIGDLLVCRISAGRCDIAIDSGDWEVDALLPGADNFGAELALSRAIDEYRRARP